MQALNRSFLAFLIIVCALPLSAGGESTNGHREKSVTFTQIAQRQAIPSADPSDSTGPPESSQIQQERLAKVATKYESTTLKLTESTRFNTTLSTVYATSSNSYSTAFSSAYPKPNFVAFSVISVSVPSTRTDPAFVAYLSTNTFKTPRVDPNQLLAYLEGRSTSPSFSYLLGDTVFGSDGTYLGLISAITFQSESRVNQFGLYGSSFSSTSIRNEFGTYGSQLSSKSAFNSLASSPPGIYSPGSSVGGAPTVTCEVQATVSAAAGTYEFPVTFGFYDGNTLVGSETVWYTITVATPLPSPPIASFTATPTSGNAPLTVQFNNTSTGDAHTYIWDFGDRSDGVLWVVLDDGQSIGNLSDANSPIHTFTVPGSYMVQLTAGSYAGSSTATKTITVTAPPPTPPAPPPSTPSAPVAAFATSPPSGNAPLTVSFTNQSTGSPTSYSWNFGDGSTSSEANPNRTYTTAGTYTVQLTATNAGGSSTATKTITVTAPPPTPPAPPPSTPSAPVAAFTASPPSGNAPLTVSFTNQSRGSRPNPTSYFWDFGDGAISREVSPTRIYTTAGTYLVKLTAENAKGFSTATTTITVAGPPVAASAPVASFTASPTSGNAPLAVSFSNQSTGNPTSYRWQFGDGGTSTETNPTRTYSTAGTYTVFLTATNGLGSNSTTTMITVTAPPPEIYSKVVDGRVQKKSVS